MGHLQKPVFGIIFCVEDAVVGRRPDFVRKMRLSERNPNLFGFPSVRILSKDHARGPKVLAAWSQQAGLHVPRRGTLTLNTQNTQKK